MSLSIPFPFGWLLNKKAARVEVNISLAFLHWVGIAFHPWTFVSDIAIFVLKGDVKLQLTNYLETDGGSLHVIFVWGGPLNDEQMNWHVSVIGSVDVISAGIGSIPDAVLRKLTNHRDLGIHTEMFSDGIINLVQLGVITNARKVIQTGKIVGGFAFGTRALYDFMNNNPFVGEW